MHLRLIFDVTLSRCRLWQEYEFSELKKHGTIKLKTHRKLFDTTDY